MNNFIKFYYNLDISNFKIKNNNYYFSNKNDYYKLMNIENIKDIKKKIDIYKKLENITLINQIILNKDNEIITRYQNNNYVLLKIYTNNNKKITLNELTSLNNFYKEKNIKINWGILWENKIDYFEEIIKENKKKFPLISKSINYFIGLTENAISYYNKIIIDQNYEYSINHVRINLNNTIEEIYNPFNLMLDFKVRDVSEYIKRAFYENNNYIYNELETFFNKNTLTKMEIELLIARLLYPSIYFNTCEEIIINNANKNILLDIIKSTTQYENYIQNIISSIKKYNNHYDIEEINWLKKDAL